MHPFPAAAELKFLIGLEVGQVCLDPWSTQFRFTDGGQITVQESFEHIDVGGCSHRHQAGNNQDTGPVFLRDLLQQRVVTLQVEPHALTLTFTNGSVLRLLSDEGPYECGQIYPPQSPDNPVVF